MTVSYRARLEHAGRFAPHSDYLSTMIALPSQVDAGVDAPVSTATIVITNYNYEPFLANCIESALAQRWTPLQIVVVDDGSTDRSMAILEAYRNRIEIVQQANGGQLSAYNAGFAVATGDVVFFLDADDSYDTEVVAQVMSRFSPGVAKVQFPMRIVDGEGIGLGPMIPTLLEDGDVWTLMLRRKCLYASSPGSGNAYRRSILSHLFPLPVRSQEDRHGADFFLVFASPYFGRVETIKSPLGSYRVHRLSNSEQSVSFGNAAGGLDTVRRNHERFAMLRRWFAERLGKAVSLPLHLYDFPSEKTALASSMVATGSVLARARRVFLDGRPFFDALMHSPQPITRRVFFSLWAITLIMLPARPRLWVARFGANPAARCRTWYRASRRNAVGH